MRLFATALLLAFCAILGGAAHQTWPDWWWHVRAPSPEVVFNRRIQPFLNRTCYECHDSGSRKGDFALDRLSLPVPQSDSREAWERVLRHVSNNLMPPADATQPAPAERAEFITWLDRTLHPVDPRNPDPGRVVIRRLNREEYKNTVQDLFGITFNPAESFPDDDSGHGFDHIASVLSVSPLLFERYLTAAEQVAAAVIPDPMPPPRIFVAPPEKWTGSNSEGEAALFSNTVLTFKITPPAAGRYRLTVRVAQDAAGNEAARFSVKVDDKPITELAADGTRRRPRQHKIEVDLPAGPSRIQIAFLNDFYAEPTATTKQQDRNFYLQDASLEGPYLVPGQTRPEGPLPSWVAAPKPGENRFDWYARVLTPLVPRAYRRPPKPSEIDRLAFLAERSEKSGDSPAAALQVALQAILTSPGFLFIGETSAISSSVSGDKIQRQSLSEHAIASRLAYFLWNGPPDERLLQLADRGELKSHLAEETKRLLADARSRRFVQNFAGQWLEVRNLPLRTPDPKLYPEWSPALAASMKEEILRFFSDFLTNDRPLTELLTADYTFVDARLARFYGLPVPASETAFVRTQLPADRRAGLLGQAGILTVTSYPNRTSPVLRGKFVLDKILGTPPPPPPPNIPSLAEHAGGGQPQTLRGRLELHRSNPSCASCHALIDPIGFALENYDSLGRRRETDGGQPIDSSGKLVTGEAVNSPVSLSHILANARQDEFNRNFARTLLTYALGRGLDYYDRPTVDTIVTTAANHGSTLPAYIDAVVASIAFQNQRADTPATPQVAALSRQP
ncbi:DUF1592 domain-containing protein [Rariglobus hedericola]|nr:DUF1592 domain-containing protein [Rariglobus hedericola]